MSTTAWSGQLNLGGNPWVSPPPPPLDHILYILTFEVQLLSQKYFSVNFGFYPDTSWHHCTWLDLTGLSPLCLPNASNQKLDGGGGLVTYLLHSLVPRPSRGWKPGPFYGIIVYLGRQSGDFPHWMTFCTSLVRGVTMRFRTFNCTQLGLASTWSRPVQGLKLGGNTAHLCSDKSRVGSDKS